MSPAEIDRRGVDDPQGQLERALIEEFLRARGHDPERLHELPQEQAQHLMKEASLYAAAKLAELEARAHFIHEIHGEQ